MKFKKAIINLANLIKENLSLNIVCLTTLIYLYLSYFFIFNAQNFMELELNAKGDFLAGVFAPLAFLWLVYGYFQQGRELRLQVQELKNNVAQQAALVSFQQQEIDAKYFAAKPFFNVEKPYFVTTYEGGGTTLGNENVPPEPPEKVSLLSFDLKNLGEVAKHIYILDSNSKQELDTTYELDKNKFYRVVIYVDDTYLFKLVDKTEVEFYLTINYSDIYGKNYQTYIVVNLYEFDIIEENCKTSVRIIRKERF